MKSNSTLQPDPRFPQTLIRLSALFSSFAGLAFWDNLTQITTLSGQAAKPIGLAIGISVLFVATLLGRLYIPQLFNLLMRACAPRYPVPDDMGCSNNPAVALKAVFCIYCTRNLTTILSAMKAFFATIFRDQLISVGFRKKPSCLRMAAGMLPILALFLIPSVTDAQSKIEFIGAVSGAATSGPTTNAQTVTYYINATTPYSPTHTATLSYSNQQYSTTEGNPSVTVNPNSNAGTKTASGAGSGTVVDLFGLLTGEQTGGTCKTTSPVKN